jgi:ubiquinone/menaquinone biosynthesis C-methylase UbiE
MWRVATLLALGALAVLSAAGLWGTETYKGRTIAPTMDYTGAPWLTRESRDAEERPDLLIEALGLRPGMVVADVGAGNGFHALRMAERIGPEGRVLAVEIQQEMLDELEARAREAGVGNVETILGEVDDPRLPEDAVDLALMVDVYHELSHPEEVLAALRRSLKPGGRMVLVEFRAEDPDVPIKPEHKMSKRQIMKEVPPNGFTLVEEYDELPWQHVMIFSPSP